MRNGFLDKKLSERYVLVSVKFNNLTKMYRVSRQVDGTVLEDDLMDDREAVTRWLSEVERLKLFDSRDVSGSGRYYVKVKAKLDSRVKALVIPWNLETAWGESEKVLLVEDAP